MSNTEQKLREEIRRQLEKVTASACPNIYERIQTPAGYAQIEAMMIHMVCHDLITPGACISQIESEL